MYAAVYSTNIQISILKETNEIESWFVTHIQMFILCLSSCRLRYDITHSNNTLVHT